MRRRVGDRGKAFGERWAERLGVGPHGDCAINLTPSLSDAAVAEGEKSVSQGGKSVSRGRELSHAVAGSLYAVAGSLA